MIHFSGGLTVKVFYVNFEKKHWLVCRGFKFTGQFKTFQFYFATFYLSRLAF